MWWLNWFVTPSLLLGLALVAVPVILHLIMRSQPKRLVFPALQFIKQRRDVNRRRLQLRHWLLLLLRCLAIALVAAALARPSVPSVLVGNIILIGIGAFCCALAMLVAAASWLERKPLWMTGGLGALAALLLLSIAGYAIYTLWRGAETPIGEHDAPVAAVLVFDTSPRMQYQQENKTRLEQAQETALWLLEQLPPDSKVAVVDSESKESVFARDEAAARDAIKQLETTYLPRPLIELVGDGLKLAVAEKELRQELYVFTDRTAAAWAGNGELLRRRLDQYRNVLLHTIDVGAENPRNFGLGDLRLTAGESLARKGSLEIETSIAGSGSGSRTVELYLEEPDLSLPRLVDDKLVLPKLRRRGQKTFEIKPGQSQAVSFHIPAPDLGVHQGYVKVTSGADGLAVDDVRYFTVEVKPAWPLLVVSPSNVDPDNFVNAVAPHHWVDSGQARYRCNEIAQTELRNIHLQELQEYRAVCLLDPQPPTPDVWKSLAQYVEAGGALAIFLGHNARQTEPFNVAEAQRLLPGKLLREWRAPEGDLYLSPRSYEHPILSEFRAISSRVPWSQFPVFLHWQFEISREAQTVLTYSSREPAIMETSLGSGRVLTMTTPVTESAQTAGRSRWNNLTTPLEDAWPYLMLVSEMVDYLVENGDERLNYRVGETAVLPNRFGQDPDRYHLWPPSRDVQAVLPQDDRITLRSLRSPGAYRLKGATEAGPVVRGCSANLPATATDLRRAPPERLDEVLGEKRYRLARTREEIDWGTRADRQGYEFYAMLLVVLVLILSLEQLLSNRFYGKIAA